MSIKRPLDNIFSIISMVFAILMIVSCNNGSSTQPFGSNESETEQTDLQEEMVTIENDDSPTEEDLEREEREQAVTDAGQVINNHFVALSKGDRQMLRNTVADVVTSYIGMSNVTPTDIEKYMNSLHADHNLDIKYVIRHLIVNKEEDGSTPHYKVHFSVTQIIRQGDKTGEHSFTGLSDINSEGKITSLILSQQS
jgi:hypothetical protein